MNAKYEVSIFYGSKVIAKVKGDNRQTDKQTDKQTGQKQYAPIIRTGGIKKLTKQILSRALRIFTLSSFVEICFTFH